MKILLNGNEKDVSEGTNLLDLLSQAKVSNDRPGVAVAINEDVISQPEWKNIYLKQNDRIEVIQAVQGG